MKLAKIFFCLFLISIPFGTRVLLYQFTPGFNEYSSAFLYASDIFLILFLISYSNVLKNIRREPLVRVFLTFLILVAVSVFPAVSKGLAIYNLVRLFLLVFMALAAGKIIREEIVKLDTVFAIFAGSAVFQALIGFFQFAKQSSLGLGILGEPVLGPNVVGAAKIVVDGAKILRAYGTFPHPNVLAAFLLLGLFAAYYLWFSKNKKIIAPVIFVILLGLILTFSRNAWFIAAVLTLVASGYTLVAKIYIRQTLFLLLTLVASGYTLMIIFSPYIFPRAEISITEPAVTYRLAYNKMAFDIIKDTPLGVGIGNQVLYSVKNEVYQKFGMDQVWQWQPIHNLYLLMAAEIGILGLAAFLGIIKKILIPNLRRLEISAVMLLALLLFGFFDHFLWTLQPGRLMLWFTIGLLLATTEENKRA